MRESRDDARTGVRRLLAWRNAEGALGDDALDELLEALVNAAPMVRRAALDVLGHRCEFHGLKLSPAFADALAPLIADDDSQVRAEACAMLALARYQAEVRPPDRASLLLAGLADSDPGVRQEAAAALGDLAEALSGRAEPVLAALAEALEDPHPGVGFEASFALAAWRDPRGRARLEAALGHRELRGDAIEGLRRLGAPEAVPALQALHRTWFLPWTDRLSALAARIGLGDASAEPVLVDHVRSGRFEVRSYAVYLLGRERVPAARPVLRDLAEVPGILQLGAFRALATWGHEEDLPWLRDLLLSESTPVEIRRELLDARSWPAEVRQRAESDLEPAAGT